MLNLMDKNYLKNEKKLTIYYCKLLLMDLINLNYEYSNFEYNNITINDVLYKIIRNENYSKKELQDIINDAILMYKIKYKRDLKL